MSKAKTLVDDGVRSELILQQHLKALREAIRQQLQETERKQEEELEKRRHRNALLTSDTERKPDHGRGLNHWSKPAFTSHHPTQPGLATTSSPSANWKHCSGGTGTCERFGLCKTTQRSKEEEAEAECRKQFCAAPVPGHVSQPVYREMVEQRERERKQGLQDRKYFLLSIQKPFSFQEREKEKREKLMAMVDQIRNQQTNNASPLGKPPPKEAKDSPHTGPKEQEDVRRKVHDVTSVRRGSPARSGSPKLRTAERTRKERLGFLDEKPSFRPQIVQKVPDFSRLHRALQREARQRSPNKDGTKCQPFFLRTSALPARKSRTSLETSQAPKLSNLSRSKSVGALTSTSADTLPTYITDAARSRCIAIRKSIEMRESRNQQSAEWLRSYQTRSQAMKKAVALHAKLLDPHSSLKEVHAEKLQHHRAADQQRMREYTRELRDMRARVSQRPYLFEQVTQRNARALAEQTYSIKLQRAGLKETFVEETGRAQSSEDDTDEKEERAAADHNREENVDDGEKIEDVEEKSVKSKGEEMP